jgi:hypothetical protein
VLAEVRKSGNRKFNFVRRDTNVVFGYVSRQTAKRWEVFESGHSNPIGHVDKLGKNRWGAYVDDGLSIGDAVGPAPIQGAASILLVFHEHH